MARSAIHSQPRALLPHLLPLAPHYLNFTCGEDDPCFEAGCESTVLESYLTGGPCICDDVCHGQDFILDREETPVALRGEENIGDDITIILAGEEDEDGNAVLSILVDEETVDTTGDVEQGDSGTGSGSGSNSGNSGSNGNQGNEQGNTGGGTTTPEDENDDLPDICKVTPVEAYMSTNLNSKLESYQDITDRILHLLGYPSAAVTDVHIDQIHEAIAMATEMYTRYAGYTLETMVFDSRIYKPNVGIHLGDLFTIASIDAEHHTRANPMWVGRGPDQQQEWPDDVYVTRKYIPKMAYFISNKELDILVQHCEPCQRDLLCYLRDVSYQYPCGIEELSIISSKLYKFLIDRRGFKPEDFKKSKNKVFTQGGEKETIYHNCERHGPTRHHHSYRKMYDYDIMDYRKVISVVNFQEMTSMSPLSLFAGISGLAEQTYFAWEFNNKGFSLLERHCLGEWMDMRNKVLAMDRRWNFDKYTQYFTLTPQPHTPCPTTAVIEAYVERPLRDIIKDPWVYKYALAQVKIIIGNIRGKWGDVQLLGGGVISGNRFTQEGNDEVKALEQMLIEKGGYSSALGPVFVIG